MSINIAVHECKLKGMRSISTSVYANRLCEKRSKVKGSICAKCYARHLESFRESLRAKLDENTRTLRRRLPDHDLPRVDDRYFRLESFGDCASSIQAENYVRIAQANPKTRFAVWTKNLPFYRKAFDRLGKPKNLILVFSSMMIGEPQDVPEIYRDIVDHRFTVMPKGSDPARINCGGRKCIDCLRCYRKNTPFDIYEIEK